MDKITKHEVMDVVTERVYRVLNGNPAPAYPADLCGLAVDGLAGRLLGDVGGRACATPEVRHLLRACLCALPNAANRKRIACMVRVWASRRHSDHGCADRVAAGLLADHYARDALSIDGVRYCPDCGVEFGSVECRSCGWVSGPSDGTRPDTIGPSRFDGVERCPGCGAYSVYAPPCDAEPDTGSPAWHGGYECDACCGWWFEDDAEDITDA